MSKVVKHRVKIGSTRYDVNLNVNSISGLSTLLSNKQDKNIPYSAFASSISGNYVPFLLYDSATGQYHLKRSNLAFAPNDAGARFFYLSAYGTWEEAQSGGSGGGDVYKAGNNVFTGTNTFNNAIKIDRTDYHFTNSSGTKFQLPYDTSGSGTTVALAREEGTWELLRARTLSSALTSVNAGTSVGYVSLTKPISQGDVLAIEVNTSSSASYNPIIILATVQRISTSPNTYNSHYNLDGFTTFDGTVFRNSTFSISANGSTLYFGNKRYIQGSFSGTTISWTTSTYTLYVGRVWRLKQ